MTQNAPTNAGMPAGYRRSIAMPTDAPGIYGRSTTRADQILHGFRDGETLELVQPQDDGLRLPCLSCGRFGFTPTELNEHYLHPC